MNENASIRQNVVYGSGGKTFHRTRHKMQVSFQFSIKSWKCQRLEREIIYQVVAQESRIKKLSTFFTLLFHAGLVVQVLGVHNCIHACI
jgi:hypothetical protein